MLDETWSDLGGYKDATLTIGSKGDAADGVWSRLNSRAACTACSGYPLTESQGRVHTSAAGVLVSPRPTTSTSRSTSRTSHRRVPVVRPGRPGRQHHRLRGAHHPPAHRHRRHLPERALAAAEQGARDGGSGRPAAGLAEEQAHADASADRAADPNGRPQRRIRTYNFPENRIADHRIGFKAHNLDQVSTVTWMRCSTRWPPPTSRPGCNRHDRSQVRLRLGSAIDDAAARSPRQASTPARRRRATRRAHRGRRPGRLTSRTNPTGAFFDRTRGWSPARRPDSAAAPDRRRGVRAGHC